jgi:U3 small nucleolar RNA-associated protein 25
MDDTTTQLLTLLNVSALKRKRPIIETVESLKLNKRKKTAQLLDPGVPARTPLQQDGEQVTPGHSDDNGAELHSSAPEVEVENEGDLHNK